MKLRELAMLFEAPTIEQLASALRQDWGHHWSSLVPIQPAGSQPPLFCVHGVGGNVLGFYELARRIKGCEYQVIEGAGHSSNMEAPAEFDAHCITFLKKHNLFPG